MFRRRGEGKRAFENSILLVGDERADYSAALQRHYAQGPRPDWPLQHVSAYASSHPWEDWAETWAHYLHLQDTLDTAQSFGLDGSRVELAAEPFGPAVLADGSQEGTHGGDDAERAGFIELVRGWPELTAVLNELSRSMGLADFYPFVLSASVLRKLYFVHRLVHARSSAPMQQQKQMPEHVQPPAQAAPPRSTPPAPIAAA